MNEVRLWQGTSNALNQAKKSGEQVADGGMDFGGTIKAHMDELRETYNVAEEAQRLYTIGELDSETAVMLVNKADLAVTYTMELRRRMLEAYQEISRMQV